MPIPQNPERLNFNIPLADFEIQVSKGNVEIVRRGKTYEMLTAYPDHPYCELAEGYFSEALAKHALDPNNKDICELHKNQKIKFYLRSQRELTVEEVYITGDIMQKKIGVQSGIIVQPQEFAGLICCPPKTAGDAWIVARPYDPRYLRSAKSEIREIPDIIPQHVMSLPNIRPAINLVDALNADEYRDINFQSPPASIILTGREFNTYFTYSNYNIPGERPPYNLRKTGNENENTDDVYYIACASPHVWRALSNTETSFMRSAKGNMGNGYIEVIRGRLVTVAGQLQFKPEKQPAIEAPPSATLFKLRPNVASIQGDTKTHIIEV